MSHSKRSTSETERTRRPDRVGRGSFLIPILSVLVVVLVGSHAAYAEPRRPTDPGEVIERLPAAFQGEAGRDFFALRARVERYPDDRETAHRFVTTCIERGRRLNDPRFFGFAEAVVSRVLARSSHDVDFLVLQATLLQRRHAFREARGVLDQALRLSPENVQALLTLASIEIVEADFSSARHHCAALLDLTPPATTTTCLALVGASTGGLSTSYRALREQYSLAAERGEVSSDEQAWILGVLGDLAERLGKDREAEQWYRRALELNGADRFALASLADLLLRNSRFEEALSLLRPLENDDVLRVRLAWAAFAARDSDFPRYREQAQFRLAQEVERGDETHVQQRAVYALEVERDAPKALSLARKNWQLQKEAADLLTYAAAAAAANDHGALDEIRGWARATGWQDVRLDAFFKKVSL